MNGNGQDLIYYGTGFWQIGRKDFTGYCNDNNLVQFEVDIEDYKISGCKRSIPSNIDDFSNQCNGVLSFDYLISRLKIAP